MDLFVIPEAPHARKAFGTAFSEGELFFERGNKLKSILNFKEENQ